MDQSQPTCALCGEPMPAGEEMFNYHGHSGPCPKPPLARSKPAGPHEFLVPAFIDAMNDIGRYGFEKYGPDSFQQRRLSGDHSRGGLKRTEPQVIADHARDHFEQYLSHVPHDHFGTVKHQLAAVAYNAMMEFYFACADPQA